MIEVPSLYNACKPLVAGVAYLEYAPIHYFKNYIIQPMPDLLNYFEPEFEESMDWIQSPFQRQKNKIERSFQEQKTIHGTEYNVSINGVLPFVDQGIEAILYITSQFRYIVRVWSYDGTVQVFGSLNHPLKFTYTKTTSPETKQFNGYNILFSGIQATPPFFIGQ